MTVTKLHLTMRLQSRQAMSPLWCLLLEKAPVRRTREQLLDQLQQARHDQRQHAIDYSADLADMGACDELVAKVLAEVRDLPLTEIARATTANFHRLFTKVAACA